MSIYRTTSKWATALCLLTLLIGCGTDDNTDENQTNTTNTRTITDAGTDTDADQADLDADAPDADSLPDTDDPNTPDTDVPNIPDVDIVSPDETCAEMAASDVEFEIPTASDAYASRAVLAGETIWIAYIARADFGGEVEEKAHLARYSCDGELLGDLQLIGQNEAMRDLHIAIAADDETVYSVWVMDTPDGQRVMGRSFDVDGTHLQDVPFNIQPLLKTGETVGTIWKPDLAITQDGDAVMVVEGLTIVEPRVIMQRFDRDGERVLNGFFVHDSDDHGGQYDPAVTVQADGAIQYAYLGGDQFAGRAYHGTITSGGDDPESPPVAAQAVQTISQSVRFSKNLAADFTWMSYPADSEANNSVVVRNANVLGPTDIESSSISGQISNYVDVAASPTGGPMAWMTYTGAPTSGQVHIQGFSAESDNTITSTGSIINQHTSSDDAIWPNGASITWLTDTTYLVTWSERVSGDYNVHGRILEL